MRLHPEENSSDQQPEQEQIRLENMEENEKFTRIRADFAEYLAKQERDSRPAFTAEEIATIISQFRPEAMPDKLRSVIKDADFEREEVEDAMEFLRVEKFNDAEK